MDTRTAISKYLDEFAKTHDLKRLSEAANAVDAMKAAFNTSRREKLEIWIAVLASADGEKDPAWNPSQAPPMRVMVPDTPLKPGYLIPTPDAIASSEVRRKYDAAVAANAEKARQYRFQKELRQYDVQLTERSGRYVRRAFPPSKTSLAVMQTAMGDKIQHADRARWLISLVTPRERL